MTLIRAQGRRALIARGWADLALIDDAGDCFAAGQVNQQQQFRRVAATLLVDAASRERPPVPA